MALMAMGSPLIAGSLIQEVNMAVRTIKAIRAFYLKGQVVSVGDTVSVKDSMASELISSNKAVAVEDVKPAPVVDEVSKVDAPADTIGNEATEEEKPKRRGRNVK